MEGNSNRFDYVKFRYRKRLGDIEVKYYIRQILLGLDYLHSRGVLHRSITCFISEALLAPQSSVSHSQRPQAGQYAAH